MYISATVPQCTLVCHVPLRVLLAGIYNPLPLSDTPTEAEEEREISLFRGRFQNAPPLLYIWYDYRAIWYDSPRIGRMIYYVSDVKVTPNIVER